MSALGRLWSLRRERPVLVSVSFALLAFYLAYPLVDVWLRSIGAAPQFNFWDFGAYGGAFNRWQDGKAIYVRNDAGGFAQKYLYPPVTLLLFYPFLTWLPGLQAALSDLFGGVPLLGAVVEPVATTSPRLYWAVFSLLFAWVGLQYAIGSLGLDLSRLDRAVLLWVMVGFQPLLLGLKMGQMAAFQIGLLGVSLGALVGRERPRSLASGATTALAGLLKPSYAFVGAHLLADRDRMTGALATGAVILPLSVLVFGVESHLAYLDVLVWGIEKGNSARSPALWLAPYYKPLSWLPGVLTLRLLAAGLVIVGAVLALPRADRAVFALGVAGFSLFTPKTYTYYLAALLVAAVALLAVEFDRDGHPVLVLVGLFVVSVHAFGLKFVVDVLPGLLDALPWIIDTATTLRPLYPALQPGLWGNALLVGIAAVRVAGAVRVPEWVVAPIADRT